jgi:hypothetical protein
LRRVRGLAAALIVGIPVTLFLLLWMHATREFGLIMGGCVALSVFAVVATGTDAHDAAADAAWQVAAQELPPVSDRAAIELNQASMPGPQKQRQGGGKPREGRSQTPPVSSTLGAESK